LVVDHTVDHGPDRLLRGGDERQRVDHEPSGSITLCDGPSISSNSTLAINGCKNLTVNATGVDTYDWYRGPRGDTSTLLSSGFSATYQACTAGTYWARAKATDGQGNTTCYADSNVFTVTVP
jgi:hypothetical protein